MAIIIIDIVMSEYEEIKDLIEQKENGFIDEDDLREGLIKVLGDALPRGPERDDEIQLRVVKKSQVGWTGEKKIVH